MNGSRLFVITSLFVSLSIGAMDAQQPSAIKEVFSEGGPNTSLRMSRYFVQTHPEVVCSLRRLFWGQRALPEKTLTGHANAVYSVCWSPDSKYLASGSMDNTVRIWDIKAGACVKELRGHTDNVGPVCWSLDGKYLASGSMDNTVRIWDVGTGTCLKILTDHRGCVYSVCWSPDSRYVASGTEYQIRIWDVEIGVCVKKLGRYKCNPYSICWSPYSRYIASGSVTHGSVLHDRTIRIWDVEAGTCVRKLTDHRAGCVYSVCWSPAGKHLASESWDNDIRIWDVETGTCVKSKGCHNDVVKSVCWSPDSSYIASGSCDHTVQIWDVETGRCVKILTDHKDSVNSVCWSPDSKHLASGSWDHIVRIWDISDINVFDAAIQHLSLKQQAFLISLFNINQRHYRPLIIPTGTCARATFETLPACLQQLLVQGAVIQVPQPTIVQRAVQVVGGLVQNHGQGLAAAAFVTGAIILSYLSHR